MNIIKSVEIFDYLEQLHANNNREWFNEHKKEFKKKEEQIKVFFQQLNGQINQFDLIDSYKVFRIYRDVRFSKNKTPYKTHFAASFHRQKPELRGGYYVHLSPNNQSFLAAGFWQPNNIDLLRIRKELEIDATDFRNIINETTFKSIWGELGGDELKTAPRGFLKDHENMDLIKKKMFVFKKQFTDQQVYNDNFTEKVGVTFKAILPFFNYMSEILTTDLNGESLI